MAGRPRIDVADLIGKKWQRLTLIKEVLPRPRKGDNGHVFKPTRCLFLCECGNLTKTDLASVESGRTKSCGCAKRSGKSPKYEYSSMVDDWLYKHKGIM